MGDYEVPFSEDTESMLGYHPSVAGLLTQGVTTLRTLSGRRFDWGGRLLKSNGGAQRFPQSGRKSLEECKGRRELDCESNTTSRYESRA